MNHKITSVTIPEGVTKIGGCAFKGCSSLSSIAVPSSAIYIGAGAFSGIKEILLENNERNFIKDDIVYTGYYSDYAEKQVLTCAARKEGKVEIPSTVERITGYAFYGCDNITEVVIADGVGYIDKGAFSNSGITKVVLPNSVKHIDSEVFRNCSRLDNVVIPKTVTEIGIYTFDGCSSLSNITIPDSVVVIDTGAFTNCVNLKDVYYTGTEEQWKQILIENEASTAYGENVAEFVK